MSSPHAIAGPPATARSLALDVLLECKPGHGFVQDILNRALSRNSLSSLDRRLATQLIYGVLRRRGTLDGLLRPLCSRPITRVSRVVWEAIRLGAYQLSLMDQIPPHAAIYETVELASRCNAPQAKGFVNGVLRAFSRLLTSSRAAGPAADALPLEEGQYRQLAQAALPEPKAFPVEYISVAFSLPSWLVQRWLERYSQEESLRLAFWFAGPAPLWLRCNSLRASRDECGAALAGAGLAALPGDHPQSLRLVGHASVGSVPGFDRGWLTVQDLSAMEVASALAPTPGSRVLDMCAAPGGKTTHIAELMRNQGSIIACDVDDDRLGKLTTLCARLGITIVDVCRLHPGGNDEPPAGPFDFVLVDVPCSNTGVLGRRPEARWRIQPEDLRSLVPLQTKLLNQALERVKPGGAVVYSTCSIEPEENGQVARAALGAFPNVMLDREEHRIPGRPADGGYWARLRKTM